MFSSRELKGLKERCADEENLMLQSTRIGGYGRFIIQLLAVVYPLLTFNGIGDLGIVSFCIYMLAIVFLFSGVNLLDTDLVNAIKIKSHREIMLLSSIEVLENDIIDKSKLK